MLCLNYIITGSQKKPKALAGDLEPSQGPILRMIHQETLHTELPW